MRRWGTITAVACLLAGGALWVVPWLTRSREFPAAVPSPAALFSVELVEVRPGRTACSRDVALDPRGSRARLQVGTFGRPGEPLRLTLDGAAYRSTSTIRGGYADGSTVVASVRPPERATLVRACVENLGTRRVALFASADRTLSRSVTSVDGQSTGKSAWLSFYEARRHSVLERSSATIERIAIFRPGIVGPWLLWPLAALVLLGIPAGAVWAWQRGLAGEEEARMAASASERDRLARRQERETAGDAAPLDGGGDPQRAAEAGPHDKRRA
jgi:hypothetical protein